MWIRPEALDGQLALCCSKRSCRSRHMKWSAPLNARTTNGQLPIDVAANEAIKQLIRDEDDRRRNHGYKRAVIPNPTAAEEAAIKRARLGDDDDENEEGKEEGEGEEGGQGQAQASAVAVEEDDDGENDDSASSDEDHD